MSKITVQINADTPAELAYLVSGFRDALGGRAMETAAGDTSAQIDVDTTPDEAPKKRKPGRPKGSKNKTKGDAEKPVETEVEDDKVLADAAEAQEEQKPAEDMSGAVKDLSPDEARDQAVKKMQQYFSTNPGCMPDVKKIQNKYGVAKFQDVPDDKANALLADVLLLVSGATEAN